VLLLKPKSAKRTRKSWRSEGQFLCNFVYWGLIIVCY
jgi:hypothetical protein